MDANIEALATYGPLLAGLVRRIGGEKLPIARGGVNEPPRRDPRAGTRALTSGAPTANHSGERGAPGPARRARHRGSMEGRCPWR